MSIIVRDAESDDPVTVTMARGVNSSRVIELTQEDADELTAQLVERQLNRWRDPDTDSYVDASSGIATGLRAAMAYLVTQYGEHAEDIVEALLEVWSDLPEEHARHITDAGWSVN